MEDGRGKREDGRWKREEDKNKGGHSSRAAAFLLDLFY
jgi:hypothetical protein